MFVCATYAFMGHGLFRRNVGDDLCLFDAVWGVWSFIAPPGDAPFTVDQFNARASPLTGDGQSRERLEFIDGHTFHPGPYVFCYCDFSGEPGRFSESESAMVSNLASCAATKSYRSK